MHQHGGAGIHKGTGVFFLMVFSCRGQRHQYGRLAQQGQFRQADSPRPAYHQVRNGIGIFHILDEFHHPDIACFMGIYCLICSGVE